MGKLDGKLCIVTGAAQGIGKGIATEMAKQGGKIVLWDMKEDAVMKAAAELKETGATVWPIAGDVSDPKFVEDTFQKIESEYGPIDVLVNNAGITRTAMLLKMTDEQWHDVIRVNLTALFYTTRAAARLMKERKSGSIVNVSSGAGQKGTIGQVNYASAKAGVIGMTKATALEMARYNVRCNCVAPGVIETEMTTKILTDPKLAPQYLASIPLGRVGKPYDIGAAIAFLASDESNFMTGQVLGVNGGAIMM
ncbi:glucose 1-dehydrogenase [Ramlibacter sp.]|uniref:glucose 1-dehydrogenase n=1 Tax=Ramlibacter sp. TaxID=1917967 RepID=UPI003D0B5495